MLPKYVYTFTFYQHIVAQQSKAYDKYHLSYIKTEWIKRLNKSQPEAIGKLYIYENQN